MNEADRRRIFQRVKGMTQEGFEKWMDLTHTDVYRLAQQHYEEAMFIELQPAQQKKVIERAKPIPEDWDQNNEVPLSTRESNKKALEIMDRDK